MHGGQNQRRLNDCNSPGESRTENVIHPRSDKASRRSEGLPNRGERLSTPETPSFRPEKKNTASLELEDEVDDERPERSDLERTDDAGDLATPDLCVCHSEPKIPRPRNGLCTFLCTGVKSASGTKRAFSFQHALFSHLLYPQG